MKYGIRRLATLFLTLALVSVLTFLAFNIIPGDPVSLILGTEVTQDRADALKSQLGLNKSIPVRYLDWIGGFVKGDPGISITYSLPVKDLIADRLPVTLTLALIALLLVILVAIPLGLYCVKKRNTVFDKALNSLMMINLSIPAFFLGILFIWFFGVVLKLFIPGGYVDFKDSFPGFLSYLFLPAVAIALPNIAMVFKFLRSSALTQLKADYVRTALSKGNTESRLLFRHVLKNALIPVISLLGMIIAEIFSGSIIIEQVFSLPGLGRLLIGSITSRDFPLVETLIVYIAFVVVVANFLVDVVLQLLDPRIRVK